MFSSTIIFRKFFITFTPESLVANLRAAYFTSTFCLICSPVELIEGTALVSVLKVNCFDVGSVLAAEYDLLMNADMGMTDTATVGRARRAPAREIGNLIPPEDSPFLFGFCADKNQRFRRTMEDAHHLEYELGGVKGCGYAAIFDGHAGKSAAAYCDAELHLVIMIILIENLLNSMTENDADAPVTHLLAEAFEKTDAKMAATEQIFSGCTAVVAVINQCKETGVYKLSVANVGDARAVLR